MPDQDKYDRLRLMYGDDGVARLRSARVLLFGVGGVGSNCLEALARAGIGHFVLVDADQVEESNINRQAIAYQRTVGMRKVEAARAFVADINADISVETIDAFATPENVAAFIEQARRAMGGLDFVVDAIDTVSTKLALAKYAQDEGLSLIAAMGAANKVAPEHLKYADLFETSHCPLCKALRGQARKMGISQLRVVYSDEEPIAPQGGALGTASYLPPLMGQFIAADVIRALVDPDYAARIYSK